MQREKYGRKEKLMNLKNLKRFLKKRKMILRTLQVLALKMLRLFMIDL